ncbi:unnamed protein product [Bursaphelenchus okinawaensis]|uniref:Uncharacterized protein n=1 Tax=Bursaphelenchus okinawaensis TaxID=465554 RepID=A0A811JVL8_9BILA|nr:unnamed protein product [Bursaphelenchus okinawaensis]CAG9085140.1 unnamed protein product [Bursaphelenchus okinawaensis]
MSAQNLHNTGTNDSFYTNDHSSMESLPAAASIDPIDLHRFGSDLHYYRRRIEAGVEEQRRYREMIEWVQDKLRNLRQHEAESISQLSSPKLSQHRRHRSLETLERIEDVVFCRPSTSGGQRPATAGHRRYEMEDDFDNLDPNGRLPLSFGKTYQGINEDQRRDLQYQDAVRDKIFEDVNKMMSTQLWEVLSANTSLQHQLTELNATLARLQTEKAQLEDKLRRIEHGHQIKTQSVNLKVRELLFEIQSLQKTMKSLKDETNRIKKSGVIERSSEAIIAVIAQSVRERASQHVDAEQTKTEVLKQYEMIVQKNAELENEKIETNRRFLSLEQQLKQLSDQKERAEDAIRRIMKLPNMANGEGDISPRDIVRVVRTTLNRLEDQCEAAENRASLEQRKYGSLEIQLHSLVADKKTLEDIIHIEKEHRKKLEEDIQLKEQSIKQLKERFTSLENEKHSLKTNIDDLNQKLENTRTSSERHVSELRQRLETEWTERQTTITEEFTEVEKRADERVNAQKQITEETRAELQKVQIQLVDANVELNALRREIQQLQQETSTARSASKTHEERIQALKEELETKELTITALDREVNEQNEILKKHEDKIDQLSRSKATLETERVELTEVVTRMRTEILEIKKVNDDEVLKFKAKATEAFDQSKRIEELEKALEAAKNDNEKYKVLNEKLISRLDHTEAENAKKTNDLSLADDSILNLEARLQDEMKLNESLKTEIQSLKTSLSEEQNSGKVYNSRIIELENEVARHADEIDIFHRNETSLKAELAEKSRERDDVAEELQAVADLFSNVQSQFEKRLEKEKSSVIEEKDRKIDELEKKIEALQQLKERLLLDLNEHSIQLKTANETIQEKETEITTISSEFNQKYSYIKNLYSQTSKDLNEVTQALEHERNDYEDKISRMRRENDEHSQEWAQKLKDSEDKKESIEVQLADYRERFLDVESRNNKAAEMINDLRHQLDDLNEEKVSLDRMVSDLRRMDEISDRQKRELEDTVQRLKRAEMRYNEVLNQLKAEKNENQVLVGRVGFFERKERELQHELSDCRTVNDRLLVEKVDQQREIEELKKKKGEYYAELSEYKTQLHKLRLELDSVIHKKESIEEELRRKDAAFRELLAEKGNIALALNQQEREMANWKSSCEALERKMNDLLDDNTKKTQARRKEEQERQIQKAVRQKEDQMTKLHDRAIQSLLIRVKELEKYSNEVKEELYTVRADRAQLLIRVQRLQHDQASRDQVALSRAGSKDSLPRGSPPEQRAVVRQTYTRSERSTTISRSTVDSQQSPTTPVRRPQKFF